jgi:oligo-1,6-glucosidase
MKPKWWHDKVVYQIYPRSFKDSNGDGIGDLRGIIEKLDYLQTLGVGVVWLSPVYQSPNDDNGYDISDYQAIMAEFGTLADWEELLAQMHQRDIRLVMDLVVNHTSDEHAWFVQSRTSKANPYRDYYIWRPGKNGAEPNNWASFFSGSAWEYDATTDEYYLHLFSRKQPDLNWENPKVRASIHAMMHWWLEKGIDGFRMDVINMVSKNQALPDAPAHNENRYHVGTDFFIYGPRMMEFLHEMRDKVLSHYDLLTVGEMPTTTIEQAKEVTHQETGPLSMLFQFEHVDLDNDPNGTSKWDIQPWKLVDLKKVMTKWQKGLESTGWNSSYLTNHDQPRAVSRFGNDSTYRVESAKMLATFTHLLHGTPYIYQGEEIGMTNVKFDSIEEYRDIETLNMYRERVEERGMAREAVMASLYAKSRDNARTPMQWDESDNGGFTTGTPWIKVNPNYKAINVEQALADPDSIFYYYQQLIRLRKAYPVIVYGTYDLLLEEHEKIYAFTRTLKGDRLLVILNFSAESPIFELPSSVSVSNKTLLISNYEVDEGEEIERLALRPYEARVYFV